MSGDWSCRDGDTLALRLVIVISVSNIMETRGQAVSSIMDRKKWRPGKEDVMVMYDVSLLKIVHCQ